MALFTFSNLNVLFILLFSLFNLIACDSIASFACDEPKLPKDSITLYLASCSDTSVCRLVKGQPYSIEPLTVSPVFDTKTLELQIRVIEPINRQQNKEIQIPNLDGNLCDINNPNGHLVDLIHLADNSTTCNLKKNISYKVLNYNFNIPHLFSLGLVNLKFVLLGSDGPVGCTMVKAELVD